VVRALKKSRMEVLTDGARLLRPSIG
jgi:hypothetical protein